MSSFETIIRQFGHKRILVVGDIMLDRFIYGTISRISPEAPAPIINTKPPEEVVGGAGNVARNIAALGAACDIVAVVGTDDAARSIQQHLEAYPGITPALIKVQSRVTTAKTRFVALLHHTHLLRADTEECSPISRDLEDVVVAATAARLQGCDAVILSDYNKGVLTPRVTTEILSAARRVGKPVIVDPKGTDYSRYCGATVLTPNLSELAQAVGESLINDENVLKSAAKSLMDLTGCRAVLVTRGECGVLIMTNDGTLASFDATAKRVIDVSGAGDTLVASFALALVCEADELNAARIANSAAGIVVAKKGTSEVRLRELRDALLSRPHFELREKIFSDIADLEARLAAWRREGLSVGFTNGCFDLVHPGHVQLLCEGRSYCDRLIVGLNDDASVRRLKGLNRPIQPEMSRSLVLAGLAFVDGVTLFTEDTPIELITRVKPDVLIKGADYSLDQVVGREIVEAYGGRVVLIELVPDSSTSRIVECLKRGVVTTESLRVAV